MELKISNATIALLPISIEFYFELFKHSMPIAIDDSFVWVLSDWIKQEQSDINHAHYYMALSKLFGECDKGYDDYKCSFNYYFLFTVSDEVYTLSFSDTKGDLVFYFKKIVPLDELGKYQDKIGYYQKPFDEFNDDAIREFITYFMAYLGGYIQSIKESHKDEFIRYLDYCSWIYGYRDGEFFVKCYENERDKFEKEKKKIDAKRYNNTKCY